jgi:hypothetical protein
MSFADSLKRLRAIADGDPAQRAGFIAHRLPDQLRRDLAELLHHFDRLDADARQLDAARTRGVEAPSAAQLAAAREVVSRAFLAGPDDPLVGVEGPRITDGVPGRSKSMAELDSECLREVVRVSGFTDRGRPGEDIVAYVKRIAGVGGTPE